MNIFDKHQLKIARDTTKLYHTDVFMPDFYRCLVAASYFNLLVYTRHAQRELAQDKYGVLSLEQIPLEIQCKDWELIELELTGQVISKYVLRRQVDARRSLVIVLRPENHTVANVITCWTNLNTDTHKTLDRSKYATSKLEN